MNGLMCVGLKPTGSENEWQVRMHGAFAIPYDTLGHFLHVNTRLVDRVSPEDKHRLPILRKRNSLCDHSKERRQDREYVTIHVKWNMSSV